MVVIAGLPEILQPNRRLVHAQAGVDRARGAPVTPLSQHSLRGVQPGSVQMPGYDRSRLASGIVHLGLGAFHRAHQALYTEALIERGDLRWGIVGVSLRDPRAATLIAAQDHLYSVTERHGDAATTRPSASCTGENVTDTGMSRPSLRCRTVWKWSIRSPRRTRAMNSFSSWCRSGGMMLVMDRPTISSAV